MGAKGRQDHYEVLGVSPDAPDEVVRAAYRALAAKYHPDRNSGDATAELKLKRLNAAIEVLGNTETRELYDKLTRAPNVSDEPSPEPPKNEQPRWKGPDEDDRPRSDRGTHGSAPSPSAESRARARGEVRALVGLLAGGLSLYVNLTSTYGKDSNPASLIGMVIGCGLLGLFVYWLAGRVPPMICVGGVGLVAAAAICTRERPIESQTETAKPAVAAEAHECKKGDLADCTVQCGRENAASCSNLASMYANGRGVARNDARALSLAREACDSGDAHGCSILGWMYSGGHGVDQDTSRAVTLFKQACGGSDPQGCDDLAVMYANGAGVRKDVAQAIALFKQTCDGGFARSCQNLGVAYENGTGLRKDAVRAVALYGQACDGGEALSCDFLGAMYEKGLVVRKDQARAASLYQRACNGGDDMSDADNGMSKGCAALGLLYEDGKGVNKDLARAVALYKQACDGDDPEGCSDLGDMYENGKGVPIDRTRAVSLYRQGCKAGNDWGCDQLKRLRESQ